MVAYFRSKIVKFQENWSVSAPKVCEITGPLQPVDLVLRETFKDVPKLVE